MASLLEPLEVTAAARNYNAWLFDRARPHLGRRVLDVGAGIGTFTALAAASGREVVALEPDVEFAARLRRRFDGVRNVRVEVGGAERAAELDGRFDSVLCLNVLEHIDDDARALRALREALVPGGRLLLLVPAHPLLLGATDRSLGHRRRYTSAGLRSLLAETGYAVDTLRYVNPVGAAGWLLWFRLRTPRERWPVMPYRAFDRLVPILRPLDRVPLPFGLSVWAVARRPE